MKIIFNNNPFIVIYGGTFSPVHIGHKKIVISILDLFKKYNLKKIIILPCNYPFYKNTSNITHINHRINMLKIFFYDIKKYINIDYINAKSNKFLYFFSYIRFIKKYVKKNIIIVLGDDSFYNIYKWHSWKNILENVNIIVFNRNNKRIFIPHVLSNKINITNNIYNLTNTQKGNIYFIKNKILNISSSLIRNYIKEKDKYGIIKYTSSNILQYIINNKLYKYH